MNKKILILVALVGLTNIAFTQDLSTCKKTCTEQVLVEKGAFLGVRIITAENNAHAKIIEIVPGTAAEKNKFEVNDVITKVNGVTVKGYLHLTEIIKQYQPHDIIKLEYVHQNKTIKKKVELGALHSQLVTKTICCEEENQTPTKSITSLVPAKVNFVLYPNPAVNELQISSDLELKGIVEIALFDMLGNQLLSQVATPNEGFLNEKINLKNIAGGNYLVKIMNNEEVYVNKLVVTK